MATPAMLEEGALVYSKDGKLLGTVSELRPGYFKLDSPMSLDYWLPEECLEKEVHEVLMTRFKHDDLADYRRESGSI